ncbi:hypothetical protein ACFSQP_12840 [Bizionia sediminis]|uniref:Uncharacterized protein n=1 Tax=Bizionia sediminis TaxID=1737064 RepID=A0ABW5KW28_9FLAO
MTEIILTRDSVHISDDVDAPHTKSITLKELTVEQLYREIKRIEYLPRFSGIQTWGIIGYSPISVIAHQWSELRPLMNCDMILEIELKRTNNKLHLSCFGGIEPEKVLKVLERYNNVHSEF